MQCGDHVFVFGTDFDPNKIRAYVSDTSIVDFDEDTWMLSNCKTPILTSFRLLTDIDSDPRWADDVYELDASENVMEYSESWGASDFTQLEHTGTIKFLLNPRIKIKNNVAAALLELENKAFYIDIWAGYLDCNYTLMGGYFKLFTGLCFGGEITYEYSKRVMSCKVYDYTKILRDQRFFNSPFFDGVYDISAIKEILDMAGFRSKEPFDPGYLVRYIAENRDMVDDRTLYHVDGRVWRYISYALPSEYKRLEQPAFKFSDGQDFYAGLNSISKMARKLFYFDQHGIAHYEDYFDIIYKTALGADSFDLLFAFTTNPNYFAGQLIFNIAEHAFDVESVHNHIKILSNTPDMTPLIYDNLNWDSFENPDQQGFIGYKKTFFQQEPVWGSQEAVRSIANYYRTLFKPPIIYKFQTYGLPLKALDFVIINNQQARVMKVEHTLNPAENVWWMMVECERFQPLDPTGHHFIDEGD